MTRNAPNPFPLSYDPSMDISKLLTPEEASYFQTIIRVIRWMVELGRVDIGTEISQISSFLAMPREGHLINALHIMSHLKSKHNSRLMLDPSYPGIDMSKFKSNEDWTAFYGDVEEAKPRNVPKLLGKDIVLRMFVDSDHAEDKADRHSRTGFILAK